MEQTNITNDINQPVETSPINPITPKPNNIYKYLFFISFLILIGTVVIIFFLLQKSVQPITIETNDQKEEITTTAETIKTNNNNVNQEISNSYGTVEGKICYPSEGVPPGYVLAKNIETGEIKGQFYTGTEKLSSNTNKRIDFSMKLEEGEYLFAFRYEYGIKQNQEGRMEGLLHEVVHTTYSPMCGVDTSYENCTKTETKQPIKVKVIADKTITGIDICESIIPPNFLSSESGIKSSYADD